MIPSVLTKKEKWLGMKDSNLRMTESKSVALPLGESPMFPRVFSRTLGSCAAIELEFAGSKSVVFLRKNQAVETQRISRKAHSIRLRRKTTLFFEN
jgi:hypothetical protein